MDGDSPEKKAMLDAIGAPLLQALNDEGITPVYLAKLLRKELKAKQVKVFSDKGNIIYSRPLDALDIQQRARQDAHKLMDHYPGDRHRFEGEIIEKRSPEELAALQKIVQRVVGEIKRDHGQKVKRRNTKG